MSKQDIGGSAFPVVLDGANDYADGMTLLDWFAGQALVGVMYGVEGVGSMTPERRAEAWADVAQLVYEVAAAMVAEKRKREAGE